MLQTIQLEVIANPKQLNNPTDTRRYSWRRWLARAGAVETLEFQSSGRSRIGQRMKRGGKISRTP